MRNNDYKTSPLYMGLDVGTTGIKASVLDKDGKIYAHAYRPNNLIIPGKNMAELNGEDVWKNVKKVLREAAGKAGADIQAMAVSTFGEAFVLLDKYGNILCNSMLFLDCRGAAEMHDISMKLTAEELFAETGMTLNPMFTLNKLLWIKKNMPGIYEQAAYIMNYEDFIIYRLTGQRKVSHSNASRTMFYHYRTQDWSQKVLDSFCIDRTKLSVPAEAGTVAGVLRSSLAAELSLNRELYVVLGGHDQACAALGAGADNTGDCFDGMGTNECIAVLLDVDNLTKDSRHIMLKHNYAIEPSAIKDRYMTLAYNPGAASVLNWYTGALEKERSLNNNNDDFYKLIESECSDHISELFVLPYFSGSGTPYCDADAAGAILGLSLNTKKCDILKAIYESMCFEIELNVNILQKAGINLQGYSCTGGLSNSDLLLQIKADISGKPVYRCGTSNAGISGLARLCANAMGERALLDTARPDKGNQTTFTPNTAKHKLYREKFKIYKNLYPNIKNIYNEQS